MPATTDTQPTGSLTANSFAVALVLFDLQQHFAAYHRLFQDRRGLDAMQKYFDYAAAHEEFLLGTHSFLAPLYASFYEMEYSCAGGSHAPR